MKKKKFFKNSGEILSSEYFCFFFYFIQRTVFRRNEKINENWCKKK